MSNFDVLSKIANLALLAFMITNMLGFGMRLALREVIAPLRDVRATLLALLANFVLVPIATLGLIRIFEVPQAHALGLVLLATAAGDPGVTKYSQLAKGEPAYTLAMMIALQVVTVFYMPLVLPHLVHGVAVDPFKIAEPLMLYLLLPLVVGFAVRMRWAHWAERYWESLDRFSTVAMILAMILFIVLNAREIAETFGSHLILVALIFVWIAFFSGYLCAGRNTIRQSDLALQTTSRGASVSLVIGVTNFPSNHEIVVSVMIYTAMVILTVVVAAGTWLRPRDTLARSQAA